MSRIAGSGRDIALWSLRRSWVPIGSTVAASFLHVLPIVATTPLVPDLAYLMLIAWRLLRPEMWAAQLALPLGLLNDLLAGDPLGQSMALWTMTFLAFDLIDSRAGWRDYWMDWMFASISILLYTAATWWIARLMGSRIEMVVLAPQLALSIVAYPLVARLVVTLDRWRLSR